MGNKREILHKAAAALLTMTMLASCAQVKNIAYFQDKAIDHPEEIDKHGGIVIQQPQPGTCNDVQSPSGQLSGRIRDRH